MSDLGHQTSAPSQSGLGWRASWLPPRRAICRGRPLLPPGNQPAAAMREPQSALDGMRAYGSSRCCSAALVCPPSGLPATSRPAWAAFNPDRSQRRKLKRGQRLRLGAAEVDALLYKPGHPADRVERALRIPALSIGWRDSFIALLEQARNSDTATGNAGLVRAASPKPAWAGFRPLRITSKTRESDNVTSLLLEPADGRSLSAGLPGQFVVLRLRPAPDAPPLLRSYSLSGEPSDARYRISVKRNTGGVPKPISLTRFDPVTSSR